MPPRLLPHLLSQRGRLGACHPLHQERIERGKIYVAPPDNHLLLRQGSMEVVRGPKENGHRPAVDTLFRSASAAYGSRVIGVVLSGYHDCGTAGMLSIDARGGVSVVQTPDSAQVPDMPQNVLRRLAVDHVVPPRELASLLARLVAEPAGPERAPHPLIQPLEGSAPGVPAAVECPGHTLSLQDSLREQGESLERALWASVHALDESAALCQRLSRTESKEIGQRFHEKASTQREQAELIRQLLLHGTQLNANDAAAV